MNIGFTLGEVTEIQKSKSTCEAAVKENKNNNNKNKEDYCYPIVICFTTRYSYFINICKKALYEIYTTIYVETKIYKNINIGIDMTNTHTHTHTHTDTVSKE
eukprot:GHVR01114280.1.p1 GENE.GHVR01114280.1~~GHVR01114280.1.p1  ORF type:complete len:109 (+),score=50.57 GHVR01114280.1:23-328(+)